MAEELMLKVEDVYKKYRLGTIGGGTLTADLQSWWAKVRHKEDPNSKIGAKTYGKNEVFYALNGISFEVRKGEALGIIGGNGAGKSTTLKLISQVTAPTEGKIYLNGRITSMLEVGTGFHPELTGRENIYLNGAILGMTKAEIDSKIEEIIDFSECRQFIDTPVKRYSSGMYVKLAFSVAAHLDSEIMIMDEVLAVGDVKFQNKCIDKMKSIATDEGRSILYVSHNMNTIRQLCDRCIVLKEGKVIYNGSVEDGIKMYLNDNIKGIVSKYDVSSISRTAPNYGKKVHIDSLEFIENKIPEYYSSDVMRYKVVWRKLEHIDNLRVRMEIYNDAGTIVGMSESDDFLQFNNGAQNETYFSFPLNNLCPDKYYFRLSMFTLDNVGFHEGLDDVKNVVFVVDETSSSGTRWNKKYWGNVRLGKISILKEV